MSVRLTGFDVRDLFSHALLWGAAAIAEDGGVQDVRIRWNGAGLVPVAEVDGLDDANLARLVRQHAVARASTGGWIDQPFPLEPERGLFSPRVKRMGEDRGTWEEYTRARHDAIDGVGQSVLDQRLIAALGEPAWWVPARNGPGLDQDAGASRLEMQPRNRGSEFVASRLRPSTRVVAGRPEDEIIEGLTGRAVRDEMGKNASDSRTATNLRPLGPTDDSAGYVAVWGLSCTAVLHQPRKPSWTTTSLPMGQAYPRELVVPVWDGPWTTARLRAVLASSALELTVRSEGENSRRRPAAVQWLREHGVRGLVRTEVRVSGSSSAPERRAVTGTAVRLPTD